MANMFDENGNYNKTEWKPGDRITAGKLNKIEESLEAINNNDIERHKEADERLDALEEQNEAVEERFDELEDLVADNKTEVKVLIYENNVKMGRLEQEMNDGIDTVEAIAHTVDDKIADADASMKAQVAEAEDIVDQGKADMEAMVAEVEKISDLEAIDEQLAQMAYKPYTWEEFINGISEGIKAFEFVKGIEYDANESVTINYNDVVINCNNCVINVNCGHVFTLSGENIILSNCNFIGKNSTGYGVNLTGSFCNVNNIKGYKIKYSLVMNNGQNNNISNIDAIECGWDCVSNYGSAKNSIIRDCRAIRTGRHGFSTDINAENIKFINCYCEDIGSILNEGHTSLHFEGAINCQFIDCTIKYTKNHLSNNEDIKGILIGLRNELSVGCSAKNIEIIIDEDFNPLNGLYFVYNHNANISIEGLHVFNKSNYLTVGYLSIGILNLFNFEIEGRAKFKQMSTVGYLQSLVNGVINLPNKDEPFYESQYGNDGLYVDNIRVDGGANVFDGRYINCIIKNSYFKNCVSPIRLGQSNVDSTKKSYNNVFDSNNVENVDIGVTGGWYDGTQNNIISNCTFRGVIPIIYKSNNGSVVWLENKKQDLTYTTLAEGGSLVKVNENLLTN